MNSLIGFVKLHRKLIAWGWYQDYVVKDVFLHLLLTANYKSTSWRGITLNEGQVIIGTQKLAEELGFSRQRVRTALEKLKSTNEITTEVTNRFTVVTIVNWRDYQSEQNLSTNKTTKGVTNKQPTTNQQLTNKQPQRKNIKNNKNIKNDKNVGGTRATHGEFQNVLLSESELNELRTRYPNHYEAKIERLSRYLASTGKTYNDHFATLIDWLEEDTAKERASSPSGKASYDINEMDKIDTLDWIE